MPSWETTSTRHGTPSGCRLHQTLGETPCPPCSQAKIDYDKRWRAGSERQRRNRQHAHAQALAVRDLKAAHLAEYRQLYQRHIKQLKADGG